MAGLHGRQPGQGTRSLFIFTVGNSVSVGDTSLSGADDNGKTLTYAEGEYVDVIRNGSLISPPQYTANDRTSITGLKAFESGDVLLVFAWDVFALADHYTKDEIDSHFSAMDFDSPNSGDVDVPSGKYHEKGLELAGPFILQQGDLSSNQGSIVVAQDFTPYSLVEVDIEQFAPAANQDPLDMQFSTDGGSTYETGYEINKLYGGNGEPLSEGTTTGNNVFRLTQNITNPDSGSGNEIAGRIQIRGLPNANSETTVESCLSYRNSGATKWTRHIARRNANQAHDAFKLEFPNENIKAGSKYVVRGYR